MVVVMQRAPMMVGVLWMFQAFAFILVGLRLYTRLVVMSNYGWDDHCFNAAVVSYCPLSTMLPLEGELFAIQFGLVIQPDERWLRNTLYDQRLIYLSIVPPSGIHNTPDRSSTLWTGTYYD